MFQKNHEITMRIYYTAEQLTANGYQEGEPLLQRCEALKRRMDDLIIRVETRRQLLHASGHFFRAAQAVGIYKIYLKTERVFQLLCLFLKPREGF